MRKQILCAALALLLMMTAVWASAAVPARPSSFSYAVDYTGTLSDADKEEIAAYGEALLQATGGSKDGDQVLAVVVQFLDGMEPADYVTDIINQWGLGDNSAVLLLATGDRDIEIGAGKGLDRLFSAKMRGQLLDDNLDYFANNQFADGVVVLYEAICGKVAQVRGKTLSVQLPGQTETSVVTRPAAPATREGGFPVMPLLIAVVVLVLVMSMMGKRRRTRRRSAMQQTMGGLFDQPARPAAPPRPAEKRYTQQDVRNAAAMGSLFGNLTSRGRNAPPAPPSSRQAGGYYNTPPTPQRPYQGNNVPPTPQRPYQGNNVPPTPQRPYQGNNVPPTPQRSARPAAPASRKSSADSLMRGLGSLFGGSSGSSRSSGSSSSRSSSSRSSSSGSFGRSGGSRGSSTGRKF